MDAGFLRRDGGTCPALPVTFRRDRRNVNGETGFFVLQEQRALSCVYNSPRFRCSNFCNSRGLVTTTVLPWTRKNFWSRNFASVRDNVSLVVPISAASTRLVRLSLISTGAVLPMLRNRNGRHLFPQRAMRV